MSRISKSFQGYQPGRAWGFLCHAQCVSRSSLRPLRGRRRGPRGLPACGRQERRPPAAASLLSTASEFAFGIDTNTEKIPICSKKCTRTSFNVGVCKPALGLILDSQSPAFLPDVLLLLPNSKVGLRLRVISHQALGYLKFLSSTRAHLLPFLS